MHFYLQIPSDLSSKYLTALHRFVDPKHAQRIPVALWLNLFFALPTYPYIALVD